MAGAKSIDPLKIVKQHPWSAVGITTVLGFVGALWFNPSRNTWLRKRMGQLEKRVDRQMKRAEALAGISDKKETQKAAGAGIFASAGLMAAREGWKFLQPMVMEKLSALIPQPPAEQSGNGRHATDHEEMAAGARETPPTV